MKNLVLYIFLITFGMFVSEYTKWYIGFPIVFCGVYPIVSNFIELKNKRLKNEVMGK